MKELLSKKNVEFEYVDITENLANLKEFLMIRDTSDKYRVIYGSGRIGIPCIESDGKVYLEDIMDFLQSL